MTRIIVLLFAFLFLFPSPLSAQNPENRTERGIVERIDRRYRDERGFPQVELLVMGLDGERYHLDTSDSTGAGWHSKIEPGDHVTFVVMQNLDGTESAYLNGPIRTYALLFVAFIFVVVTLLVGLTRGFRALLGIAFTLIILFGYLLPAILHGKDAVTTTILASLLILAVNMHLTHGWKRKTFVAFASTAVGLVLACVFAYLFIAWVRLSGLASEEATLLYIEHLGSSVNMSGILLSGIILGSVGALDDVAIMQGEFIAELRTADPSLRKKDLFLGGMRLGRHHIASIANTLVLAYAGAALPTLLIFWALQSVSVMDFLNTEVIAEEIVRTLAGTTALILTVPISTWFAVSFDKNL